MAATNPTARVRASLVLAQCSLAALAVGGATPAQSKHSLCEVEATLQPATRRVVGMLRITTHNASQQALDTLSFSLPRGGCAESFVLAPGENEVGSTRPGVLEIVSAASLSDGGSMRQLNPGIESGHPRRLVVPLRSPLPAGKTATVQLRFRCHLRGRSDSFVCVGWYPECDLDGLGHRTRATIRARLEAPERFVLAASGGARAIRDDSTVGDKRVLALELIGADRLAFVADPTLVARERSLGPFVAADDPTGVAQAIAAQRGVDVASFDLPKLSTRIWLPAAFASEDRFDRYFRAARVAYEFFGLRTGAYPCDGLTVIGRVTGRMNDVAMSAAIDATGWVVATAPAVLHARSLQPERAMLVSFGRTFSPRGSSEQSHRPELLEAFALFASARLEQLEYAPTTAPVQTSSVGGFVFAAAETAVARNCGLYADRPALPLARLLPLLPDRASTFVRDAGFSGAFVPESPLLELLETMPTAALCREAGLQGGLELRASWLAAERRLPLSSPAVGGEALRPNDSSAGLATLMWSLEQLSGRAQWWSFLRALRSHCESDLSPLTDDAIAVLLAEHTSREIADFYRAANEPNATFDYGIESIVPVDGRGGVKSVVVRRTGTLRADVRVRFRFAGRSLPVVRVFEAGHPSVTRRFTFDDAVGLPFGDLLEVAIDPQESSEDAPLPFGNFPIDRNLLDNAWRADADHDPAAYRAIRGLLQVQSRLSFAGIIG